MKKRLLGQSEDDDPISVVANLFDVAMVFAVALMVAIVTHFQMTEIFSTDDFTMIKNPGKENMEIITRQGNTITRFTPDETVDGTGTRVRRVGVAYELESGEVIYIPE
ncbi:MAG TPA: hypothetical protein DCM62_01790 [Bacteroidales bacterium]|nr:hypothetical protein [Bacteroidales bacterium]